MVYRHMPRPALSASRAISILNFLASNATEEYKLSDLATSLEINLASAHALLTALTDAGYLVRHPRLRTYSLGPTVIALGSAALQVYPAIDDAQDEARRLSEELNLGVAVTTLSGDDILFLSRIGEYRPHEVPSRPGQRIPLVPPVGAVFVAWMDPEPWLAVATDRSGMEAVLSRVRSRGWAVSLGPDSGRQNESSSDRTSGWPTNVGGEPTDELQPAGTLVRDRSYNVVMIAAPVFDPAGRAVVALTLLGFEPGLSAERIVMYGEKVRDSGLIATRRSGGHVPSQ
jgi:DNA-binding IclR family transcriptional regulator